MGSGDGAGDRQSQTVTSRCLYLGDEQLGLILPSRLSSVLKVPHLKNKKQKSSIKPKGTNSSVLPLLTRILVRALKVRPIPQIPNREFREGGAVGVGCCQAPPGHPPRVREF